MPCGVSSQMSCSLCSQLIAENTTEQKRRNSYVCGFQCSRTENIWNWNSVLEQYPFWCLRTDSRSLSQPLTTDKQSNSESSLTLKVFVNGRKTSMHPKKIKLFLAKVKHLNVGLVAWSFQSCASSQREPSPLHQPERRPFLIRILHAEGTRFMFSGALKCRFVSARGSQISDNRSLEIQMENHRWCVSKCEIRIQWEEIHCNCPGRKWNINCTHIYTWTLLRTITFVFFQKISFLLLNSGHYACTKCRWETERQWSTKECAETWWIFSPCVSILRMFPTVVIQRVENGSCVLVDVISWAMYWSQCFLIGQWGNFVAAKQSWICEVDGNPTVLTADNWYHLKRHGNQIRFVLFRYSYTAPADNNWGAQGYDGMWNGIIGDLQRKVSSRTLWWLAVYFEQNSRVVSTFQLFWMYSVCSRSCSSCAPARYTTKWQCMRKLSPLNEPKYRHAHTPHFPGQQTWLSLFQKVDMAATSLTNLRSRAEVMDYVVPFYTEMTTGMYKKPGRQTKVMNTRIFVSLFRLAFRAVIWEGRLFFVPGLHLHIPIQMAGVAASFRLHSCHSFGDVDCAQVLQGGRCVLQ